MRRGTELVKKEWNEAKCMSVCRERKCKGETVCTSEHINPVRDERRLGLGLREFSAGGCVSD